MKKRTEEACSMVICACIPWGTSPRAMIDPRKTPSTPVRLFPRRNNVAQSVTDLLAFTWLCRYYLTWEYSLHHAWAVASPILSPQTQTVYVLPLNWPLTWPILSNLVSLARMLPTWFIVAPHLNLSFRWSNISTVLAEPLSSRRILTSSLNLVVFDIRLTLLYFETVSSFLISSPSKMRGRPRQVWPISAEASKTQD